MMETLFSFKSQATTPDLNAMTCAKIFIQRDYTDGTMVRFQTHFPQELEGKVSCQLFNWNSKIVSK